MAGLPANARPCATRSVDSDLCATREIRGRPPRREPAGARRRPGSRLLRSPRADRCDRALRPRPRDQVRDVRDQSHQGRDHRRAALTRLGAESVRTRAREIERAIVELERSLHRAPTDEEIAAKVGITTEELEDSLSEISRSSMAALDELWSPSGGGDQIALIDTIQDDEAPNPESSLEQTEMKEALGEAIARLPEREKLVVTLYYYEELTLREIGEVLGVTESRVSQLHTKAVLRLKARLSGGMREPAETVAGSVSGRRRGPGRASRPAGGLDSRAARRGPPPARVDPGNSPGQRRTRTRRGGRIVSASSTPSATTAGRGCARDRSSSARSPRRSSSRDMFMTKRLVDLELVDRQPLQVRRATSSPCRSRRSRARRRARAGRASTDRRAHGIGEDRVLGDLELEPVGGTP